jgi:hypothetical protein
MREAWCRGTKRALWADALKVRRLSQGALLEAHSGDRRVAGACGIP